MEKEPILEEGPRPMDSSIISASRQIYNGGLTAAWAAISKKSVESAAWKCVSPLFKTSSPLCVLNSPLMLCAHIFFSSTFPISLSFKIKNLFKVQTIFHNINNACVTGAVIADLTGNTSMGRFYIICRMVQLILIEDSSEKCNGSMKSPLWNRLDVAVTVMSGILFALQGKLDLFGAYHISQNFPEFWSLKDQLTKKNS